MAELLNKMISTASPDLVNSPYFIGYLVEAVKNAPAYHVILEVLLIALVLRLWFFNSYKIEREYLTEAEQEQLIQEWQPEPLIPSSLPQDFASPPGAQGNSVNPVNENVITGAIGKHVTINGSQCLDLASFNFLGIIGDSRVEKVSIECAAKYGVGSCGPRGFYGTIDVHLDLEKRLAQFMGVEEAIIYSYGFATVASAIAAYAKKGDILYVDDAANFAIQQGAKASRSTIKWFKHNDLEDLEQLLKEQEAEDRRNPKKATVTRKFVLVEGLYLNRGDLCPLPQLINLKYAYKVRIFLDESYSFAALGKTGRGVCEHFDCDKTDIDQIFGSLETSVGSVGGFSCGSSFVIDHQRLAGSGYCFSASAPPLLCAAANEALDIVKEEPHRLLRLQENAERLNSALQNFDSRLMCISAGVSPIQHLVVSDPSKSSSECKALLRSIRDKCIEEGYAIVASNHIDQFETFRQRPSIRLCVKHDTTAEEIESFVNVLKRIIHELF